MIFFFENNDNTQRRHYITRPARNSIFRFVMHSFFSANWICATLLIFQFSNKNWYFSRQNPKEWSVGEQIAVINFYLHIWNGRWGKERQHSTDEKNFFFLFDFFFFASENNFFQIHCDSKNRKQLEVNKKKNNTKSFSQLQEYFLLCSCDICVCGFSFFILIVFGWRKFLLFFFWQHFFLFNIFFKNSKKKKRFLFMHFRWWICIFLIESILEIVCVEKCLNKKKTKLSAKDLFCLLVTLFRNALVFFATALGDSFLSEKKKKFFVQNKKKKRI